jgi:3-deoxy-D-manno-octulosonic acid kinase
VRPAANLRCVPIDDGQLCARADCADALAQEVRRHGTLYAWAASFPQGRAMQGRGVVYVAPLPQQALAVAVRHAWHGGLFAPITGDRFFPPTRAPREAAMAAYLRGAGIPTPEIIAYARYRTTMGLNRVDVASQYIADAWDLGAVLAGQSPIADAGAPPEGVTKALLRLLKQLAHAQVVHPDLNVKNVLVVRRDVAHGGPQETSDAWVLDVDVARRSHRLPVHVMQRNVARLARSMRKWQRRFGITLPDDWMQAWQHEAQRAV